LCGSRDSFLDEVIVDDAGGRMFVCSDSDYCGEQRAAQDALAAGQQAGAAAVQAAGAAAVQTAAAAAQEHP